MIESQLSHFPRVHLKNLKECMVQVFILPREYLFFVFDFVQGRLLVLLHFVHLFLLNLCFVFVKRFWLAAPLFLLGLIVGVILVFGLRVVVYAIIFELTIFHVAIFVLFFRWGLVFLLLQFLYINLCVYLLESRGNFSRTPCFIGSWVKQLSCRVDQTRPLRSCKILS